MESLSRRKVSLNVCVCVCVCKQDTPTYPEIQRRRADGQRWRSRVKCVWDGDQSRVLSASPAAGAGRHTWHRAQATPADVSLVSQLCVCVCVSDTDTHPHSLKRATCAIIPPPPPGNLYHSPLYLILLFSLPLPSMWWTRRGFCHHDMICQNVTLHTCRLPGDEGASSADQRRGWSGGGGVRVVLMQDRKTSGKTAETGGNRLSEG